MTMKVQHVLIYTYMTTIIRVFHNLQQCFADPGTGIFKNMESRIQAATRNVVLCIYLRSGSPGLGCGSGKITPVHRSIRVYKKSSLFILFSVFRFLCRRDDRYTSYGFTPRKNVDYMVTIKYLLSYNRLTIHITVRERRRE